MPRLRLRSSVTGAAYKLELSNDCTWGILQDETRRTVGLAADADIVLSLNKRTPLSGEPNDPLAAVGICNGDLLWLLSPGPPGTAANGAYAAANYSSPATRPAPSNATTTAADAIGPAPPKLTAACTAQAQATAPPAAASNSTPAPGPAPTTQAAAAGPSPLAAAVTPPCVGAGGPPPGPLPTPGSAVAPGGDGGSGSLATSAVAHVAPSAASGEGAGGGSGAGGDDGCDGGDAMNLDAELDRDEADLEAVLGPPGVSLKLRRLLGAPPAPSTLAAAASGCTTFAAATAAAPSYPPWRLLPAASRCLLLLDCALGDAGFQGLQDPAALASAAPSVPLPRQLLYSCSYLRGCSNCSDGAASGGTAAPPAAAQPAPGSSGDSAPGASATAATAAADSRGGGGGSAAVTEADATMAEAEGSVTMAPHASVVGAGPTATGSTTSSSVAAVAAAVKLMWYSMGRYLVVHGTPCAAAAAAGGVVTTLHIDLSEYGDDAGCTAAAAAASGSQPTPTPLQLLPRGLPAHWRRLKDDFVLPLLAASCRTAGVPPPLGLTVLPMELQLAVLRRLEPRDLAALSGVCTSLHHLASEDELWRPLYDKEFGGGPGGAATPAADVALANSRGYKYLYGRRWRERAERRKRRQVFRAPPPSWGPPPVLPHFRPPYMPPGSIGGDYDRLPGPLLGGGGPAFFGGGGRLPGGPGGPVFFGGGPGAGPGLPGGLQGPPGMGAGRRPGAWGGGFGGGFI